MMIVTRSRTMTLALALVAAACNTEQPSAPRAGVNLAASAGGVETNESIPLSLGLFVPCANGGAGEDLIVSGTLHVLLNVTLDARGGAHTKTHFQPQGLTGLGFITGDKYQGTGVTQDQHNTKVGETFTFVNNFRMIGQGPGNNFLAHENMHVTVNANGVATVQHDNLSIECK